MVYLGYPIIMAHWNTAKSVELVVFGQGACSVNRRLCSLSGWGVLMLAFNLDYDRANGATINHFSFFNAISLSISAHCAFSFCCSFSVSLSLADTHMHKYTPQGMCWESMLHCSTALLFSMHPAVLGIAAGLTAIIQLSVCACWPSLWTVSWCKNISRDRQLSICLFLSVCLSHTQLYSIPSGWFYIPFS